MPLASSADATVSPAYASMTRPLKRMAIGLPRSMRPPCARRKGCAIPPLLCLRPIGAARAHRIGGNDAVACRIAQRVEPALAAVRMQPALRMHALRVRPIEEVLRPVRVIDLRGLGRPGDMRLAAAAELDLGTGAAVRAGDKQHGTCHTAVQNLQP